MALVLLVTAGCGGKKPTPEAPTPAPAPMPAAPAPAPEPEPEPAPEVRGPNTDFNVAITWADGSSSKGHVTRVERTSDWFGDEGWTGDPDKIKVTLEGGGTEIEAPWTDIQQVDITYGTKADLNCSYDSNATPTMYICDLKTTTKVKTKDGKTWDAVDRHKWRFVTESGEEHAFWIYKLPARKQEEKVPEIGSPETDTTPIYAALEQEINTMKTGKVPKTITVVAP
jgi:hypothetical protein